MITAEYWEIKTLKDTVNIRTVLGKDMVLRCRPVFEFPELKVSVGCLARFWQLGDLLFSLPPVNPLPVTTGEFEVPG